MLPLLVDTSAWGASEWGLVVAVIGLVSATILSLLSYRLGIKQGKKAEEARQAENERREREETRATLRARLRG